jgi:16S rRNA (cytosine1402-N4)-methyltransferase
MEPINIANISEKPHQPVMLAEVLSSLSPKENGVYVDCTLGAGGYTRSILNSVNCKVYGIDRDENVREYVDRLVEEFGLISEGGRFEFLLGRFSEIERLLKEKGVEKVDGIVMDLGVSSMQLDRSERGFSFTKEARLDMRMGDAEMDAYDVVNSMEERQLADVIFNYGDEVKARQIAKKICEVRKKKPIETTIELADIVRNFYPQGKDSKGKIVKMKIDPATKTFQAIRIYINDELNELRKALYASKNLLRSDGRLVVVTFHSLEDKIVKQFMRDESGYEDRGVNKYKKEGIGSDFCFTLGTKKAIKPSDEEVGNNVRSRSAKLRFAIKN